MHSRQQKVRLMQFVPVSQRIWMHCEIFKTKCALSVLVTLLI